MFSHTEKNFKSSFRVMHGHRSFQLGFREYIRALLFSYVPKSHTISDALTVRVITRLCSLIMCPANVHYCEDESTTNPEYSFMHTLEMLLG